MTDHQQFLYTIKPTRLGMLVDGGTNTENQALSDHFGHLQRLVAEGTLILAGRTQTTGPETFGIVIFSAADEKAARAIMAADPAVSAGVMLAELFPYRVALMTGTAA